MTITGRRHGVEEGYVLQQDGRCTPLPKRT